MKIYQLITVAALSVTAALARLESSNQFNARSNTPAFHCLKSRASLCCELVIGNGGVGTASGCRRVDSSKGCPEGQTAACCKTLVSNSLFVQMDAPVMTYDLKIDQVNGVGNWAQCVIPES